MPERKFSLGRGMVFEKTDFSGVRPDRTPSCHIGFWDGP